MDGARCAFHPSGSGPWLYGHGLDEEYRVGHVPVFQYVLHIPLGFFGYLLSDLDVEAGAPWPCRFLIFDDVDILLPVELVERVYVVSAVQVLLVLQSGGRYNLVFSCFVFDHGRIV